MAKKKEKEGEEFDFTSVANDRFMKSTRELLEQQAQYRVYSTGSLMLDAATGERDPILGNGGIPQGTILEVFGQSMSGKSILCDQLTKSVLEAQADNYVLSLASEEPDADRYINIGLDLDAVDDRFFMLGCYRDELTAMLTAERHLDTIKKAVRDPRLKLVVIDSIKALCSEKQLFDKNGNIRELENDKKMALMAQLIEDFLREYAIHNNCAIMCMTNQLADKLGVDFTVAADIRPKTFGGRFKEYACNLRVEAVSRPIYSEKEHLLTGKKVALGWEVYYRLVKNKFSNRTGVRTAVTRFMFDTFSFDKAREVFDCAEYLGLIHKGHGGNCVIDEQKIKGVDNAIQYLRDNPKIMKQLEMLVLDDSEKLFSIKENGQEVSVMG